MAVYEQNYRLWSGSPTPDWRRFLVIPKFAFKEIFRTRLFSQFYMIACLILPFLFLALIYITNNRRVLEHLEIPSDLLPAFDNELYFWFLFLQGWLALFITYIVGPSLISIDMVNNALPLYLSKPLSKIDYMLGKIAVLGILLSLVTWVPGWILYVFQSTVSREPFFFPNLRIAGAIFLGSWAWILFLSLISIALSAYVKRKQVARAILFGSFIMLMGLSRILVGQFNWRPGRYFRIDENIQAIWAVLLALDPAVDPWIALAILLIPSVASAFLLYRKVRPLEIMR